MVTSISPFCPPVKVISFVAQAASSQVTPAPGKPEALKSSAVTGASETAKVAGFHGVIAITGSHIASTNMDAGRNFPATAAFLGNHYHVFFQFPGTHRRTGDHFFLKHFGTSARGITQNLVVFSAAKAASPL